jgi:hypothetical protein
LFSPGDIQAANEQRRIEMRHLLMKCGFIVIVGAAAAVALGQDGTLTESPRAREVFIALKKTEEIKPAKPVIGPKPTTPPARGGQPGATASSGTQGGNSGGRGGTAAASPDTSALALRCKIQLEVPEKGEWIDVDGDRVFSTGDHIRVGLTVTQPVYVYVAQKGTSGKWEVLFPYPSSPNANYLASGYAEVQLPPEGKAWNFKGDPGLEHLFIAVSRQPIVDLQDEVEKANPGNSTPQPENRNGQFVQFAKAQFKEEVVSRMLRSRDLLFSKFDSGSDGVVEHAVYYANERNPSGSVVAEIKLKHQP